MSPNPPPSVEPNPKRRRTGPAQNPAPIFPAMPPFVGPAPPLAGPMLPGFEIACLYVGQGDCIIVKTPKYLHAGEADKREDIIMIDCGSSGGINEGIKGKFQNHLPGKIDFLILTHADNDHHNLLGKGYLNGKSNVVNTIIGDNSKPGMTTAEQVWKEWCDRFSKSSKSSIQQVKDELNCKNFIGLTLNSDKQECKRITFSAAGINLEPTEALVEKIYTVSSGSFNYPNAAGITAVNWKVEVIAGQNVAHSKNESEESNAVSLVTLLTLNSAGTEKKALLTGDANRGTFQYLLDIDAEETVSLSNIEILQIPHHGSFNFVDNLEALITLTQPQYLFTSVKFTESVYFLPRWEALKEWKRNSRIEQSDDKDHYIGYWITLGDLVKKRIGTQTNLPPKKYDADVDDDFIDEVKKIVDDIKTSATEMTCLKYNAADNDRQKNLYAIMKKEFTASDTLIFVIQFTKKKIYTNGANAVNEFLIDQALKYSATRSGKIYSIGYDKTKIIQQAFDNIDRTVFRLVVN